MPRRRRHPIADGRSTPSSTNSPRRPMSSSSTRRPWFPSRRWSPREPSAGPAARDTHAGARPARAETAAHRRPGLFGRARQRSAGSSTAAPAARTRSTRRTDRTIVVTASRYSLASDVPEVHTFLSQEELEALPRLAEDALKVVHRLPGAASNGLAGLAHMRGGDTNETLVMLDGLPLYEPFHLRLLQSPASVLDERIIDGIDVYAGGFTANYGDRMSAIINARSLRPDADAYYELGLSLMHANALASHRFAGGRGQWLASFRRSNLDEIADVFDSTLGEPKYMDGFARVDYEWSPSTRGSLHTLLASDHAEITNPAGDRARRRGVLERLRLGHAHARLVRATERDGDRLVHRRRGRAQGGGLRTRQAHRRRRRRARLRRARPEARCQLHDRPLAAACRHRRAHARGNLRLRRQRRLRGRLPVSRCPGAGHLARARTRALRRTLRGVLHGAWPADGCTHGRAGPALGRGDLRRRRRQPARTATEPGLERRGEARDCSRARAASSSSRASRNCRSRMASPSFRRHSMPITTSSGWNATSTRLHAAHGGVPEELRRPAHTLRKPVRPAVAGAGAALGSHRDRAVLGDRRRRRTAVDAQAGRRLERLVQLRLVACRRSHRRQRDPAQLGPDPYPEPRHALVLGTRGRPRSPPSTTRAGQ